VSCTIKAFSFIYLFSILRQDFLTLLNEHTAPLFRQPHVIPFAMCCFIQFGLYAIVGGMAMFLPSVLNKISQVENTTDMRVCQIIEMNSGAAVLEMQIDEELCNASLDKSIFIDSMWLGVVISISSLFVSLTLRPLGRQILFSKITISSKFIAIHLNSAFSHRSHHCRRIWNRCDCCLP